MDHIQNLPVETLHRILNFVSGHSACPGSFANEELRPMNEGFGNEFSEEDVEGFEGEIYKHQSLRHMCLVSRTFREIAQRLLFHTFRDDNFPYGDLRKTVSFAKAIYHHPKLGEYVNEFKFLKVQDELKAEKLPADDATLFRLAIQALELGDQEEKRWISLMLAYDISVFIALVVVKLPYLQGLTLQGDLDVAARFKPLFDRDPSFLSQVRSLCIGYGLEKWCNLATYEDFLTRPKLQSLTLESCDLDDVSFPSTWTPGSLAIEDLFIHESRIDSGAISKLIQACKKLKVFSYLNYDPHPRVVRPESPTNASHFTTAEALEAARPHKKSLVYFNVQLAQNPSAIYNVQKYLSSRANFGSFRDFTVLKTIMVPHAYLPIHPELPLSLEHIVITDCNSSIQSIAENVAKDASEGLYPKLLSVRVHTSDVRDALKLPGGDIPLLKTPADCLISLEELFIGTKVRFEICPFILPDGSDDESDDEDYEDDDLGFDDAEMPPWLRDALSGSLEQLL